MGFGREARRVRDESLPFSHRLHALGSCLELAQPIGFTASWSYLQAKVGVHWREPEFLLPALDRLLDERAHRAHVEGRYASWRRAQKRVGHRTPVVGEVTAGSPSRWHGDEQTGARHAIDTWLRRHADPGLSAHHRGAIVLTTADRAIHDSAGLSAADLHSLQECLMWSRRQTEVLGWEHDREQYRIAWAVQRLLGQVYVLVNGATPPGVVWQFPSRSDGASHPSRGLATR